MDAIFLNETLAELWVFVVVGGRALLRSRIYADIQTSTRVNGDARVVCGIGHIFRQDDMAVGEVESRRTRFRFGKPGLVKKERFPKENKK